MAGILRNIEGICAAVHPSYMVSIMMSHLNLNKWFQLQLVGTGSTSYPYGSGHPPSLSELVLSGPAGSGPHNRKRTDGKDPSSCVSDASLRN